MPSYEVEIPGKGAFRVDSPTELTDQQAYAAVLGQLESAPAQKRAEDVGFIEGAVAAGKRGIESLGDIASGLGLAGTSLTGTEEETRRKMQAIRAEQTQPQATPGTTFADLERIYQEKGILSALGQVPKYATEQILQSAPQMAGPLAAGAAASPFLTPVGGAVVGMGTYALQQFGNFLVRQAVEKDDPKELEVAKAAMTAAGTAPIGYFADRFTFGLGSLGKTAGKEVMTELAKRSGAELAGGVAKQVGKGVVSGVIAEAPTEVLEQAAERYQAGLSLSGPEAMNEYKEAFFGAAAAGGGIKGVSTGLELRSGIREARATPEEVAPVPGQPVEPQVVTPEIVPPEGAAPEVPMTEAQREAEAIREMERARETAVTPEVPPEIAVPPIQEPQAAPTVEAPVAQPMAEAPIVEPPQAAPVSPATGVPMTEAQIAANNNYLENFRQTQNSAISEQEPQIPSGYTRFYHGGYPEGVDGPLYFTTDRQNAEGWAGRDPSMGVYYVDVPNNDPRVDWGDISSGMPMKVNQELPPEIANNRVRIEGPIKKPAPPVETKPLPADVHPLEAWAEDGVKDADKIRQDATKSANAAGIDVQYGVNKIDPERTRVDWNEVSKFKNLGGLLNHIQPHVPVDYAEIIKKILPSVQNIPVQAVDRVEGKPNAMGAYIPSLSTKTGNVIEHRLELSMSKNGNDISTIVHEAIHGATVSNYYRGKKGDNRYSQAAKELDALTSKLGKLVSSGKANIPFMSTYTERKSIELLSWGQTDREVQAELKKIVMPNKKTAWSEFVNTMRKLLGLPANQTTALEHLLDISERLTSQQDVLRGAPRGPVQEEVDMLAKEVRTPEFRKWFGDSKVVDENGQPLVVYHGTPSGGFSKFDSAFIGKRGTFKSSKLGHFFSSNPTYAGMMAIDLQGSPSIYPIYLSIQNPLRVLTTEIDDSIKVEKMIADAKRGNHDGIIDELGNFVVFKPNQIKSIFNERPTEAEEILAKEKPEEKVEYPRKNVLGENIAVANTEAYPSRSVDDRSSWSKLSNELYYEYVDKFVDLKNIINAINRTSKKLATKWDAYMRETLYHGRVKDALQQFDKQEMEPLAREMYSRGVSIEDINAYLAARHAVERNREIDNRNEGAFPQRGSGIHDWVAEAYMKRASKEEIRNLIDALKSNGIELNNNEQALLKAIPAISDAKFKSLQEIAKQVDAIIKKTQQIAIDNGLEKKETIDYWNDLYKHYAPLRRSKEELEFAQQSYGFGRGYSAYAGMGKAATGSLKTIDNILHNIILQRDMTVVKAERARIGRAIIAMFLMHPNPDVALVVNPTSEAVRKAEKLYAKIAKQQEKLKGLKETVANRQANGLDTTDQKIEIESLTYSINQGMKQYDALQAQAEAAKKKIEAELSGMDLDPELIKNIVREPEGAFYNKNTGKVEYRPNPLLRNSANVLAVPINGETRYVIFHPGNPEAARLGAALKGADTEQLGRLTALVAKFTRWIAQVNTQYNPFFGIVNMMRDIQGAQFNLSTTPLAGQQMAVNKNIYPAASTIWQTLREGKPEGPLAAEWREMVSRGGTTGIKDMLVDQQKNMSILDEKLADLQRKPSEAALRNGFKAVVKVMSDFNDTMENAVRLAAFIEAKKKFLKQGMDPETAGDKAAELAKNLTVNFNRKGAKTQFVNSLFAFFNASVQGTARLAETLKGPAGKKIMGSLVLLGVIQQLMLSGFDDDDPPEFVRQKNLVIPRGDGKYLSFPMPLGFNLFVNTGRLATSTLMGGDVPKNITHFMTAVSNTFNPLGGDSLVQTVTPTVLDPAVSLYGNVDAFGRPIYREDHPGKPVPGYLRSTEGSTDISRGIAKMLNYMTGGTEFMKGEISPTADHIDYLAGQLGGGAFREARKVAEFGKNIATGEETAPYRVPLAGRFMGDTGSEANVRNRFYENIQRLAGYEEEIKGRAKAGKDISDFMEKHPEANLYKAADTIYNEVSKINKARKQLVERGASKQDLKQLNDYKIQLMRQLNAAVEQAKPK